MPFSCEKQVNDEAGWDEVYAVYFWEGCVQLNGKQVGMYGTLTFNVFCEIGVIFNTNQDCPLKFVV